MFKIHFLIHLCSKIILMLLRHCDKFMYCNIFIYSFLNASHFKFVSRLRKRHSISSQILKLIYFSNKLLILPLLPNQIYIWLPASCTASGL